jgi:hypothetical protein
MMPVISFAPVVEVVGHVVGGVVVVKVKNWHGDPPAREVGGIQFKTGNVTPWPCPTVGIAHTPQSNAT